MSKKSPFIVMVSRTDPVFLPLQFFSLITSEHLGRCSSRTAAALDTDGTVRTKDYEVVRY